MKLSKLSLAILVATGSLTLGACSSSNSSSSGENDAGNNEGSQSRSATYTGTAIDGLLQGATVCIDNNYNFVCDEGEVTTQTNNEGKYEFTVTSDDSGKPVVVYAGPTTPGNETGKPLYLMSKIPTITAETTAIEGVTSPFTTLLENTDLTEAQLKTFLGLPNNADLTRVYSSDPTLQHFATDLAQTLADQLATYRSASTTPKDILLGENGVLTQIKNKIEQSRLPAGKTLADFLQDIKPSLNLNFVADASISLTIKNSSGNPVEGVNIVATAFDQNTQLTSDDGFEEVISQTNQQGRATLNLPKYSEHSTIELHLTMTKEGYVPLEKVIKGIKAGTSIPTNYTMAPQEVKTVAIEGDALDLGQASAASLETGQPAITFALISTPNGKETILTGNAAAQAMAEGGNTVKVGIQIPTNRIDTTKVKAITAGIKGFNPNNNQEAQSFPGTFEGKGDPASASVGINTNRGNAQAAAEEETYRLVSSAFANISLTDQNGQSLTLTTPAEATAAATENPVIYLRVPTESFSNITLDENNDAVGIQVPIYAYYTGWTLVGLGTLVVNDNGTYSNYSGSLPLPAEAAPLYVKIEITEGNSWIQWINLDHPIKSGSGLVDITYQGDLKYEGEEAEPFDGSGYIELPDGGQEWIWIDRGHFEYQTLINASEAASAKLYVYNPRINDYESPLSFTQDSNSPYTYTLSQTLQNPYQCSVAGNVKAVNGDPKAWQWLNIHTSNYLFYTDFYTDEQGNFVTAVPCQQSLTLGSQGIDDISLNVNGTAETPETSDDGQKVILSAIQMPNIPPYAWAYSNQERITIPADGSASFTLSAYGWDDDSNDLTFSFNCPGGASAQSISKSKTQTCTLTPADLGGDDQKVLPWRVTVTDSDGASSTSEGSIQAELENINHAPQVWNMTRLDSTGSVHYLSCSTSGQVSCYDTVKAGSSYTYKINATDPDGDTLSYQTTTGSLDGDEEDNLLTLSPTENTTATITVTDNTDLGSKSTQATLHLTAIQNQPPVAYVYTSRSTLQTSQTEPLYIYAYAWDDFTLENKLIYSLEILSPSGDVITATTVEGQLGVWSLDPSQLAVGNYTVTLSVTDEDNATSTTTTQFNIQKSAIPELYNVNVIPNQIDIEEAKSTTLQVSFSAWDDNLSNVSATIALLNSDGDAIEAQLEKGEVNYSNQVELGIPSLSKGEYTIKITLQDEDNDPVIQTTALTVTSTQPPQIQLSASTTQVVVDADNQHSPNQITLSYIVEDDHPETLNNLTLSLEDAQGNPVGATQALTSPTGEVNWDVSSLAIGSYTFKLTAQDGDNEPVSQTLSIQVSEQQQSTNTTISVQ